MTENLESKLCRKQRKRSSNSATIDREDSDFEYEVKKPKKSQYFDTAVNNEREAVNKIANLSRIAVKSRKTRVRKKACDDSSKEICTSKKLTKIMDKQKENQSIVDTSAEVCTDNEILNSKKRRKDNGKGEDASHSTKKKKHSQVLLFEDHCDTKPESKSIKKVEIKNFSRTKKDKYTSPKDTHKESKSDKTSSANENLHVNKSGDDSDSEDADDWEDVAGDDDGVRVPKRPIRAVEITVHKVKGKKTPEEQMQDEIRCAINRMKSTVQKYCHQVHLLCYLARGLHYNKICNDMEMQAIALSHVPIHFFNDKALSWKSEVLSSFVSWFHGHFPCSKSQERDPYCHGSLEGLVQKLKTGFEERTCDSSFEHTLMVVVVLRSLGLSARLVHSFQPLSSKPDDLLKKSSKSINLTKISRKLSSDASLSSNKVESNGKNKKISKRIKKCDKTSGDDDDDDDDGKFDWWSEVHFPEENRWMYVNSHTCVVDDFNDAKNNIKRPFSYVVGWRNDDHVKDLTSRYDPDWLPVSCRKRVDPRWWNSTLTLFKSNQQEDDNEDRLIEDELYKQPLPASILAYKNHPLYVLSRHLLKFECIYPPTSLVLGFVKDEPVYSRDCVHVLHSREKWMVEGRVLKDGEEPYKVVKRRPKNSKNRLMVESENLDLFGRWQTEQFAPKPAIGGIVPKNEFGNVEIFKPWMLPPGTVLIEDALPGLNKVAKKLDIDVAPAMLGWEFHRNISAPVLRGWVVCTEHEEILRAAWNEEQKNIREKELEKRQERVLKNWKKLIKALMIREKLKEQFNKESSTKKKSIKQTKAPRTTRKRRKDVSETLNDTMTECKDGASTGNVDTFTEGNVKFEEANFGYFGGGGFVSDEATEDEDAR